MCWGCVGGSGLRRRGHLAGCGLVRHVACRDAMDSVRCGRKELKGRVFDANPQNAALKEQTSGTPAERLWHMHLWATEARQARIEASADVAERIL